MKVKNIFIPNAPKGTQVINGEQTFALNSRGLLPKLGVHAYANGSLSDEEQEKLSEEFENNPQAASKELVLKLTNWSSNVPIVADLGKAMAIGFSQSIANVLKDLLGEVKEPVNGDWTPVIKSAAAKMHVHLTNDQIQRLLRQIQTESGGNGEFLNKFRTKTQRQAILLRGYCSLFLQRLIPGLCQDTIIF